jgi:hypothetical protein
MPGVRTIRGKVNVVLNGLVREGVITRFRTNFDVHDEASAPVVTVTTPSGRSPEDVQVRVINAIAAVAIGIDIIVEPA